jgi:hypothetical protein
MSIEDTRMRQILAEAAREALVAGRIPLQGELKRNLIELTKLTPPSMPRMQMRLQAYRSRFDREAFNKSTNEALADLSLLYGENVDTVVRVLNGINADDVDYKSLRYQLSLIDDILESLLLAEPGATGYFFSAYDSFNDLSKVDQGQTTADVNLDTGAVYLPVAGGVNRIDLGFLQNRVRAGLKFDPPQNVTGVAMIGGTKFGNMFNDVIGDVWIEEAQATVEGPISAEFIFPVATKSNKGVVTKQDDLSTMETVKAEVSRIEVDPASVSPMSLQILYSIDGANYTQLPNWPNAVELRDKKFSFTFPSIGVKFLKFRLTKSADNVMMVTPQGRTYRFIFGIRSIALYNSGFATSAELLSNVLEPDGPEDGQLNRLALDVDERVPTGTDIEYYVAANAENPDWKRISPGSRNCPEGPAVVEFGATPLSSRFDNRKKIIITPAVHSTKNGISFYTLYTLGNTPVPKTVKLFRGIGSWRRTVNTEEQRTQVRNNYVVFTMTDNRQKLYLEIEDEEVPSPPPYDTTNPTYVPLKHSIFKDESVPITPIAGNPRENPNYSVRQLVRYYTSGAVGGSGITGATIVVSLSTQKMTVALPLAQAQGKFQVGYYIYLAPAAGLEGYYKVLGMQEGTTVNLTVDNPGNRVTQGYTGTIWSVGSEDITSQIQDVDQNQLVIRSTQAILSTDRLVVSYRQPLGPEHQLVTTSIVMKPGQEGTGAPFEVGRDYVVDPEEKAVARISEGTIRGSDQIIVRVDFEYLTTVPALDTYVGFFMVDSAEPKIIELSSQLGVDTDAGEGVYIDDGAKVYDVSRLTKFPPLPRGWRQVTIRSNPIKTSAGVIDTTCAIYKALLKTDALGNLVFHPNGNYFTKLLAFPQALKETNLFKLQTGVLMDDRGWCAPDGAKIVINWDPSKIPDTIYPSVSGPPYILSLQNREDFEVEYRYRGTSIPAEILFKAVLVRFKGTSTYVTPELRSYNLKFSY